MSREYILHGGNAQAPDVRNDKFFAEVLKKAPESPRILLVHFASDPEKLERNFNRDSSQFTRVRNRKNLTFIEADPQELIDQIKVSDVIYFGGGTTTRLLDAMKKYKGLKEAFDGKVIAGESAGMNFLAAYCYSKSGGGVMKCLGIIPFKTIPHYKEEFSEAKKELEAISGGLQTIALPEFEYFVYSD